MQSNFLNDLGLGGLDLGLVVLILAAVVFILLIMIIVLLVEHGKLKKRYNRFCQGRDGKSLEKEIGDLFAENAVLREQSDKSRRDIKLLFRNMEKTFQKVGLIKYDAFNQMGGMLSFSLCLLNEKNDGFIINSVHGTDGCYTYSKEIKRGRCELTLGEEEEKALNMAMQN